jgi:choline-glycine betaine transporter
MKGLLNGKKINTWVFWPPFLIFVIASILSVAAFDTFTGTINTLFQWVATNFGWFFVMTAFGAVVLSAVVFLSPAGKIKFGGEDAESEFGTWEWFAMSLTAGIGTGIVFWGVAEPVMHLANPPAGLGIEAFSAEAANFSMRIVYLFWSFTPYALYILFALPIVLVFIFL